jgi:Alcohol dehydrogenase GroES-like domain
MSVTYSAIEVTRPGEFSEVRRPVQDPGPGQVRIRVEACGVCHSDAATVDGLFPIAYPRVPGHEAVGRIDALRFGRPRVGRWSAGWRRISRRVLRLLRALSQRRSGELPASGIYGHSSRRRLCRNDDREGERPRVDPERSLVGRCGAAALRRPHNLQRAAKRDGEGWRSRCQAFESLCQRRRGSRSTGAMMKDPNPMAAERDGGQRTGALHPT